MKKALLVFLFIGFVFTSCKNGNTDNIVTVSTNDKTQSTLPKAIEEKAFAKLSIDGMTCGNCSNTVERATSAVKGVTSVSVSLMTNRAEVTMVGDLINEVKNFHLLSFFFYQNPSEQ